jgi:hypothetical protein
MARDNIDPTSTIKIASKAVFSARDRRSPIRTMASPTTKITNPRSETWSVVNSVALPSGPSSVTKKFWSAFMKTFRRRAAARAYQDGDRG